MAVNEMTEAVIERIQQLDQDAEYRALSEHVAVVSPIAIELLAYENLRSPAQEAQRIAAIQLRVVVELAPRLRWLEQACVDPALAPELRVALSAVLRDLCLDSDTLPAPDTEAAALLEPALLFHELIASLRPWLPPMIAALEPAPILDLLRLGIPDYLRPVLRRRFETLWCLFHQLRQLLPARLALLADPPAIDTDRLLRLLDDPSLGRLFCPAPPEWTTPSWVSPWLGGANSPLRTLPALAHLDVAG